jgi:hypothetical protein
MKFSLYLQRNLSDENDAEELLNQAFSSGKLVGIIQIETIISNSDDFRNTDIGKIFGRVQGVIVKWLSAPFVCNSWEQDLY